MTINYRYILEKRNKRNLCPECGKKTFKRFIDTKIKDYLPEQYGRCNRESKCSYFLNPYLDGYSDMIKEQDNEDFKKSNNWTPKPKKTIPKIAPPPTYFDFVTFKKTLEPERYEKITSFRIYSIMYLFPLDLMRLQILLNCTDWVRLQMGIEVGAFVFLSLTLREM